MGMGGGFPRPFVPSRPFRRRMNIRNGLGMKRSQGALALTSARGISMQGSESCASAAQRRL